MIDLFVTPDDKIVINFVVAKSGDNVVAEKDMEALRVIHDDCDYESAEEHHAVFRVPTFGDSVEINKNLLNKNLNFDKDEEKGAGMSLDFNPWSVRLTRMLLLIKSWSLMDGDKPVPVTEEHVQKLHPAIGNLLGTMLDEAIGGF